MTPTALVPSPEVQTTTPNVAFRERSRAQRMDALGQANWVRHERSELKKGIKSGERNALTILFNETPDYLKTMKVFDFLLAVPKYGRVKVNKILNHCRIAPSKTIGGMSERQRTELVLLLQR
jgi:hypothetical protein